MDEALERHTHRLEEQKRILATIEDRRTELKQPLPNGLTLPEEAVNAWMGHSTTVGDGHYGTGTHIVDKAFDAALFLRSAASCERQPAETPVGERWGFCP